jgi:hypothetical protein
VAALLDGRGECLEPGREAVVGRPVPGFALPPVVDLEDGDVEAVATRLIVARDWRLGAGGMAWLIALDDEVVG